VAVAAISKLFGIKSTNPQPEEILSAIQADPQALVNLKMAQIAFDTEKMKLEYQDKEETRNDALEELKTQIGDVQNARGADVSKTQTTGSRDTNLYCLAWVLIVGFFSLVGILLWRPVPQDSSGVIFLLFGTLAGAFGSVVGFFFGSSRGSQAKDALLASSIPADRVPNGSPKG
jgi:translation elongation factor EF-1beta